MKFGTEITAVYFLSSDRFWKNEAMLTFSARAYIIQFFEQEHHHACLGKKDLHFLWVVFHIFVGFLPTKRIMVATSVVSFL